MTVKDLSYCLYVCLFVCLFLSLSISTFKAVFSRERRMFRRPVVAIAHAHRVEPLPVLPTLVRPLCCYPRGRGVFFCFCFPSVCLYVCMFVGGGGKVCVCVLLLVCLYLSSFCFSVSVSLSLLHIHTHTIIPISNIPGSFISIFTLIRNRSCSHFFLLFRIH